jgi:predicted DNA-binding protein
MIAVPSDLEQSFLQLAEIEHQPVTKLIEMALREFLEDYQDARIAEAAIERMRRGEGELIPLEEVERMLNEMAD